MNSSSLGDFLAALSDSGELVRVAAEVDPEQELAAITREMNRRSGDPPALLFERLTGGTYPVVTNLAATPQRCLRWLGWSDIDEARAAIRELLVPAIGSVTGKRRLLPSQPGRTRHSSQIVGQGECQQVVHIGRDVDLRSLPFLRCWPDESERSLPAATIIAGLPGTEDVALAVAQVELVGRDRIRLPIHEQSPTGELFRRCRSARRQVPVAILVGCDPLVGLAASLPTLPGLSTIETAATLRGGSLPLVKARTLELHVPAEAQLVIEGLVDADADLKPTGVVAGELGFYREPADSLMVQVTAVTHPAGTLIPLEVSGAAEHDGFAAVRAGLMLPLIQHQMSQVANLHLPASGTHRHTLFVAIEKRFPYEARQVMNAVWGLSALMTVRTIVVVDAAVDVSEESAVWREVAANVHPERDVMLTSGPGDPADHATPVPGMGSKLGIDATAKRSAEGHPRRWPGRLVQSAELSDRVSRRWAEYGLPE